MVNMNPVLLMGNSSTATSKNLNPHSKSSTMPKLTRPQRAKIEANTLRLETSHRGGGVEIDLTAYGFKGERMAAYQNYLGGGMLGRVAVNNTIQSKSRFLPRKLTEKQAEKLHKIGEQLKRYFHGLTNPVDEWETTSYEQNQAMAVSAY